MLIYGKTDIGMVRKENQDSYDIREAMPSGHAVAVVCDGMGGPAGGRLASSIAVKAYMDCLERRLESGMDLSDVTRVSQEAVLEANRAVWTEAQRLGYPSMGTTLVSAIAGASGVAVCNVGDSRAYCLYDGGICPVTRDHSLVQEMIERGEITEEEARAHPKRNLITRALGPDSSVECDAYACHTPPGASFLLCTDGLINTVTDGEILDIVSRTPPERCPDALIEAAKRRGAPDNVTVALLCGAEGGGAS
jgi:protein phosphatase